MNPITRALNAAYQFLVGDLRILLGVIVALALAALAAPMMPAVAGLLLIALIALTLAWSLRRETLP